MSRPPIIQTKAEFVTGAQPTIRDLREFVRALEEWPGELKVSIVQRSSQRDGSETTFSVVAPAVEG